jgi:hypothetical protein
MLVPQELLRRGYELLPDARWLEELERDRASDFLGMALLSSPGSGSVPIDLDFTEIDYDSANLYPVKARRVRVDLKLRADSSRWARFDELYYWYPPLRYPFSPW